MKRTVKAVFSQELKDAKPETNGLKKAILRPFSHSFGNAGMGSPTEFLTLNMSEWTALDGLSLSDDGVCSSGSPSARSITLRGKHSVSSG